jgi:hypothetical protein
MYSLDFSANESVVCLKLTLQNQVVNSAHRVYLCTVYWFQKELRFFPYASLTGWLFFFKWDRKCLLRGKEWIFNYNPDNPILQKVSTVT